MSKYDKAVLPEPEQALELAETYSEWAQAAEEIDQLGSARLYELVSLLLKYYAKNETELAYKPVAQTADEYLAKNPGVEKKFWEDALQVQLDSVGESQWTKNIREALRTGQFPPKPV